MSAPAPFGYVEAVRPRRSLAERQAQREEEVALSRAAQAGDGDAFGELCARYRKEVVNFLYRTCGDWDVAEELTQEVFLKAWLAIGDTRTDGVNFPAWVYRIARNKFLDHVRHERLVQWTPWESYVSVFHPSQVAEDSPEREALRGEGADEVRAVLDKMRPEYARLLELREFGDLSYHDLAAATGHSWAAVKSALFRARDQFVQTCRREGLAPFGYDLGAAPDRRLGGVRRAD